MLKDEIAVDLPKGRYLNGKLKSTGGNPPGEGDNRGQEGFSSRERLARYFSTRSFSSRRRAASASFGTEAEQCARPHCTIALRTGSRSMPFFVRLYTNL